MLKLTNPMRQNEALMGNDIGDFCDLIFRNSLGDCAETRTVATQASPRAGSRLGHSVGVNISQEEKGQ